MERATSFVAFSVKFVPILGTAFLNSRLTCSLYKIAQNVSTSTAMHINIPSPGQLVYKGRTESLAEIAELVPLMHTLFVRWHKSVEGISTNMEYFCHRQRVSMHL